VLNVPDSRTCLFWHIITQNWALRAPPPAAHFVYSLSVYCTCTVYSSCLPVRILKNKENPRKFPDWEEVYESSISQWQTESIRLLFCLCITQCSICLQYFYVQRAVRVLPQRWTGHCAGDRIRFKISLLSFLSKVLLTLEFRQSFYSSALLLRDQEALNEQVGSLIKPFDKLGK
jgi:hypothetical protein